VPGKGPPAQQLAGPVAAAEEADAEHAGPPGGEEVPDGIADHVAVLRFDAERLLAGEEEVRRRLRARNVAPLEHDRFLADPERLERRVDLGAAPGGGDPVDD